jgi:tripartite ATP-independent transporter DctM subunit
MGENASFINAGLSRVTTFLNNIALAMVAACGLLTAVDVILRYVFNRPIFGSNELIEFMLFTLFAFSVAHCAIRSDHIIVDILTTRLPDKTRVVVETITGGFSVAICAIIAWRNFVYAGTLMGTSTSSTMLNIPVYPFLIVGGLGFTILTWALLADFVKSLNKLSNAGNKTWAWLPFTLVLTAIVYTIPIWYQSLQIRMDPLSLGFVGFGVLIILLLSGMPIGFLMALIGYTGMGVVNGINSGLTISGTVPFETVASYDFSVIPLFILMGAFCHFSGMTTELFDSAYKWFGRMPGGLAIATIAAASAFAAVSGSSLAGVVAIGTVALPELRKHKYDDALSTGCIAAGGGLDIMIPPSIILVIYGIITRTSIGKLYIGALVPGIMQAVMYMMAIYIICKINPNLGPPGGRTTFGQKVTSLKAIWAVLLLFVLVMGGLYAGVFTPTEAAGVGAFGAFVIAIGRRKLSWKGFVSSLRDAVNVSAMSFMILVGAAMLGYFFSVSRLPHATATLVASLGLGSLAILVIVVVLYMILGCLLPSLPMIVLTVPIFFPMMTSLGFDPVWFGIIIVLMVEAGQITPPVGINVFVMHGIAKDVPMYTIYKGIVPFLIVNILNVIMITIWPELVLYLPRLMK